MIKKFMTYPQFLSSSEMDVSKELKKKKKKKKDTNSP